MNHKNKRIKRLKRNILIFLCIFIIVWFILGLYLKLNKGIHNKLESIGYSNIEISIIDDILSTKNIKKLYKYSYIDNLTEILVDQEFKSKKLTKYIDYYLKYNNVENEDLLYIINNDLEEIKYNDFTKKLIHKKNYRFELIDRYEEYYNKYKVSIDDSILAVNYDLDKYNIKINDDNKHFIKEEYCIFDYLDRYIKYKKDKKDYSNERIVREVNSNLDKIEYNYKSANTNLGELVLINKYYSVPYYYEPKDLIEIDKKYGNGKMNKNAYNKYIEMFNDAKSNNIKLNIIKGYASYYEYYELYGSHNKPGFDDIISGYGIYIKSNSNAWLQKNAYKFGFILRYPDNKKYLTGISNKIYYRYVGIDAATMIYKNNLSLEEYYAYYVLKRKS